MQLVVDMGNTRLKWATVEHQQLITGEPLLNEQINQQTLHARWQALKPPQQLAIACVTANQRLELVVAVAVSLWPAIKIIQVTAQAQACGITNAYAQPEKLGVDRWLALCAARHFYALPACIVDCGTAITIDLVNGEGRHLGGFISPGLTLMKKSLSGGTDALPFNNDCYSVTPANFTEAAIYSGTLLAAVGLIEKVLATQSDMVVILTGGDAELIAPHLSVAGVVNADLVLYGLAIATTHSHF
jgi:type III pantothenate kinase